MKVVYRFDQDGKYVEPVNIYPDENGTYIIPDDCTDQPLPQPNYEPIFDKTKGTWTDITVEEWKAKNPIPEQPKSDLEIIKENQELMKKAMDDLILGGAM